MMGGEGPRTVIIMWTLTGVVFVFLILRLYTRIFVVRSVGLDDHMYLWSWVFLFLHNLFVHVAATYGFGQDQSTLSLDDGAASKKWELIGQTFVIVGMGMSKMSLALFLLRVVIQKWHRVAIWTVGGSLLFASCLTAILCWLQCLPAQRIYDSRVKGRCIIYPVPWAILLGSFCIFVDFFFALFPWVFLYDLEMKRKEKLVVGISLSFGVLAGICGIVRTINLTGLGSENYSGDTVKLVVWCQAEMAVTLACIAVPCIIPLYTRVFKGSFSDSAPSSRGYHKHSQGTSDSPHEMGLVRPQAGMSHASEDDERKTGINGPFTEIRIMYSNDGSTSDEAILNAGSAQTRKQSGIMVREEVSISSSTRIG